MESEISEIIENAFEFMDNYFDCSNDVNDVDSGEDSDYFDADAFNSESVSTSSIIHQAQQNHIYQPQSPVNSASSNQTVLQQSIQNSNVSNLINSVCQNGNHLHLNTYGSNNQMNTSVSSHEEILHVADVADLLHPQYAIITGGRSKDGCPLITFPDNNNFQNLNENDYEKLMMYLTSVPSLQEADLGFNLIIDRRKDRWASVKSILLQISLYFPGIVHFVFVLRPSGFLQKAISEVSSKFFKEDFRFRLVVCSTIEDLYEYVCKSQLSFDLGGDLYYSHHDWIQQRISLEKFSGLTSLISCDLDIFMKEIHDIEFPNSVESTENLIQDQRARYEKLKETVINAGTHGELLLEEMKKKREIEKGNYERFGNISSIERLLVQLEETSRHFDEFWNAHLAKLKKCLELRRFEQAFRELQAIFDKHLKTVADMTEIGETVSRMDELINETKEFQQSCEIDMIKAEEVIATGQTIIGSKNCTSSCPKEVVQPKCEELRRVCEILSDRITKRLEILNKARELMERVEKANRWCTIGVELISSQKMEKCSTIEQAEQCLKEVQTFMESSAEFKLSSPKEFKNMFEESTTLETKALVTQVLQRIDDVQLMCEKRIVSLKKIAEKPKRPVQTVTPHFDNTIGISKTHLGGTHPTYGAPNLRIRRGPHKIESFTPRPRSMDVTDHTSMLGPDSGISVSGDTTISSPDSDLNSQDSDERRLKRGHVLSELLETERIYVAEMNSILKGYRDEMQSEEMSSLVPPGLQDKADILFGNLHELYAFHSETFLKDLENCISTTELVALCFVQRRDTFFRLYSYYCQNIPRSERLRETLVDTHLFLQECQKKLGHKLPLAAYLLKPVQRITKYQLLLKDLLKFSDTGTCSRELQKALDCMLVVLKCVNDSMHQIAITGFPADLSQQGELLLQDSFQIWTESKKDLRLRLKTQQRHIFLYQKALLFCKHGSKAAGHNKSTYQFKHWLQMSQIGLTENVRGDSRRFEVWLQGRQEVHTIQANTLDIKNKWVAEIKRVLLNQLEELKGEKIKQYGGGVINHKPLKHAASWDMPQSLHSINNRTQSCDQDIMRIPNVNEDMISATGISSSSSEHDNQETNAWSSDYSNSEDEFSHFEENVIPGTKFKSLADYCAMGHSEVSMKEGDIVELLKVGCAGWWFVNVISNNHEGWAPAAYLEPVNRKSSRMRAKSQDRLNDH